MANSIMVFFPTRLNCLASLSWALAPTPAAGIRDYKNIIVGSKDEYNSLLVNKEEELEAANKPS